MLQPTKPEDGQKYWDNVKTTKNPVILRLCELLKVEQDRQGEEIRAKVSKQS